MCFVKERGPDHPSSAQGAGRAARGWKVGVNLNGSTVNHRANAERPQVGYASQQDGTCPTDWKDLSPLVYLHSRVSWWTKGWSSTCYRWCETSSLLKVTSESARWLWPGGKERRFGAQHARTRLALVGSYDTAAFAGDDAELTDWLLLANQVKCFGSCQAKKSQLYGSSTYSSYRAEQRSDCKRRCSPLWFEMLAHGERWHKIKSFHNGCL